MPASSQQDRQWSVRIPAPWVAACPSRCDSHRPAAPSEQVACGVPRSNGGCLGRFGHSLERDAADPATQGEGGTSTGAAEMPRLHTL